MKSDANTAEEYVAQLPPDRREAISVVRKTILENLPDGLEEVMDWGMISYQVPLSIAPDTYNGKPLMYAALASQKNHMAVYLTAIYMSEERRADFEKRYRESGKRMDAGKSCVRFKKLDDLPVSLIGDVIGSIPVDEFVARVGSLSSPRKAKK